MMEPRWIENDAPWYEQRLVHCDCCGRLIAKHLLVAEIEGRERIFCSTDCAALFRDYVLPVRGEGYRPPEDATKRYEDLMVK
jgi:hypothetical protein